MNYMARTIEEAGRRQRSHDSAEFVAIARHLVMADGDVLHASKLAANSRCTARIATVFKTAVSAGSIASTTWAAPLVEYDAIMSAFLESLFFAGAFDAMLPSMRRVPLRTRVAVTTAGASGATIGDNMVTPISSLQLAGKQIEEEKAIALLVINDELARLAEASGLFGSELRNAIAVATDVEFCRRLTTGISTIPSNGGTSIQILQDIDAAATAISTDAASKLFLIVESSTAKKWAFKTTSTGTLAFPGMTPGGGTISGVPVLVSDGTPSASIIMCDANQIAAGGGSVELDTSRQADIQFDTTPDSPPSASTVLKSLWQHNQTALKAMRYFGAERLRDTAVSIINGISYSGNSPG